MTTPLPKRPVSVTQQAKAVRLREALRESKRVRKDYAMSRGKHFMKFIKESAQADLASLEISAVESVERMGFDVSEYAAKLERENAQVGDDRS